MAKIFFDNEAVIKEHSNFMAEKAKFSFSGDQLVKVTKDIALIASFVLGKKKSNEYTYILNICSNDPENFGDVLFHFGVKYNKGTDENDPGNFSIIIGFGEYKPADENEKVVFEGMKESSMLERAVMYNTRQNSFAIQENYLETIISTTFEFYIDYLKKSKGEETFEIVVPGMMILSINPDGVMSAIAESEVKKRIKSDEMLAEVR
ncbi:MAG: hypothetical protein ACRCXT_09660 [Paraclostridium sp.]